MEWCGAVNAMVVKNMKDANVPLKCLLTDIQKDLAARKSHFHSHYIINTF